MKKQEQESFFTFLFIGGLINSLINAWGEYIYILIKSEIILFIALILILILMLLILLYKKVNFSKILILLILTFIFEYLLLVLPYYRGERIDYLKNFGSEIVQQIIHYQQDMKTLPENIEMLYPNYISSEQIFLSKKIIRYHVYEYSNPEYPQDNKYFTLNLYEDFMDNEYLSYNMKTNTFRLTDD